MNAEAPQHNNGEVHRGHRLEEPPVDAVVGNEGDVFAQLPFMEENRPVGVEIMVPEGDIGNHDFDFPAVDLPPLPPVEIEVLPNPPPAPMPELGRQAENQRRREVPREAIPQRPAQEALAPAPAAGERRPQRPGREGRNERRQVPARAEVAQQPAPRAEAPRQPAQPRPAEPQRQAERPAHVEQARPERHQQEEPVVRDPYREVRQQIAWEIHPASKDVKRPSWLTNGLVPAYLGLAAAAHAGSPLDAGLSAVLYTGAIRTVKWLWGEVKGNRVTAGRLVSEIFTKGKRLKWLYTPFLIAPRILASRLVLENRKIKQTISRADDDRMDEKTAKRLTIASIAAGNMAREITHNANGHMDRFDGKTQEKIFRLSESEAAGARHMQRLIQLRCYKLGRRMTNREMDNFVKEIKRAAKLQDIIWHWKGVAAASIGSFLPAAFIAAIPAMLGFAKVKAIVVKDAIVAWLKTPRTIHIILK